MSRYKETQVKIDKDTGNRVYGLTIYPRVPIQDGDLFVTPTEGDRLENLAYRYYEDTSLWWVISKANPDRVRRDGLLLQPGIQIRIPSNIEGILSDFENLNRIR